MGDDGEVDRPSAEATKHRRHDGATGIVARSADTAASIDDDDAALWQEHDRTVALADVGVHDGQHIAVVAQDGAADLPTGDGDRSRAHQHQPPTTPEPSPG